MPEHFEIFLSYSHEDEELKIGLDKHLEPMRSLGLIWTWNDRKITAGSDWQKEISEHLETASVVLFLVSADFFDSGYCSGIEMKRHGWRA